MKTSIKYLINGSKLTILCMLFTLIMAGCAGLSHHSDPLADWKPMYQGQLDNTIVEDYKAFIQTLPPKERTLVHDYSIWQYENETGGHAVRIRIYLNGTILEHILIYDQNDERVRTTKYVAGKYSQW
jgi:hypothetical protein